MMKAHFKIVGARVDGTREGTLTIVREHGTASYRPKGSRTCYVLTLAETCEMIAARAAKQMLALRAKCSRWW